ncbi:MAG: hypothetical protein ACOYXC_10295 [Candidatus Rifleibacteriota bacterium]
MSERFNPHQMQKLAGKWPVSPGLSDLSIDLVHRFEQSHEGNFSMIPDPLVNQGRIDAELLAEYGYDAGRLAKIIAQNEAVTVSHLDSAFRWLARLFQNPPAKTEFSPAIWFEAFLQAYDNVVTRKKPNAALALIRRASKSSWPSTGMPEKALNLTACCLYPFAPVFALSMISRLHKTYNIKQLLEFYPDCLPVRFASEKGGWHWAVFDKNCFSSDPVSCFSTCKWVKSAAGGKPITARKTEKGWLLCLN